MKKNLTCMMAALCGLIMFSACSSDSDGDGGKNDGSNNTTDVAVTGALQEVDINRAVLTGYVNLNLLEGVPHDCLCGIQYAPTSYEDYDPTSSWWGEKAYAEVWNERKMTITLNNLTPNQEYYFRTFVYADGRYYFGATKKFKTKTSPAMVTATASNITKESVDIICTITPSGQSWYDNMTTQYKEAGIAVSLKKEYLTDSKFNNSSVSDLPFYVMYEHIDSFENGSYTFRVDNISYGFGGYGGSIIQPGTTYYYCAFTRVDWTYKVGEVKSFTTPE